MRKPVRRDVADEDMLIGLCAHCRHANVIESSHGETFYLCRLSFTDPRFPKYPHLPVLTCDGYEPSSSA